MGARVARPFPRGEAPTAPRRQRRVGRGAASGRDFPTASRRTEGCAQWRASCTWTNGAMDKQGAITPLGSDCEDHPRSVDQGARAHAAAGGERADAELHSCSGGLQEARGFGEAAKFCWPGSLHRRGRIGRDLGGAVSSGQAAAHPRGDESPGPRRDPHSDRQIAKRRPRVQGLDPSPYRGGARRGRGHVRAVALRRALGLRRPAA
mmetsp:Transcript_34689/g.95614  ORF Transcript_34689/g.95614 Transcript_34689/m.95614 type:complete len:206 (+) Transcript_34689:7-624(+)